MTATAPSYVAVKRKRDDAPIQSLVLEERQAKHVRLNVEYRLESVSQTSNQPPVDRIVSRVRNEQYDITKNAGGEQIGKEEVGAQNHKRTPSRPSGPRHFELATGKRSADVAGFLPTFIERPLKKAFTVQGVRDVTAAQSTTPQKRPGTKRTNVSKQSGITQDAPEPSAALAASLHSFALAEAAADDYGVEHVKPRVIMQPKRAIRRKQPPREDPASHVNSSDIESDDKDFVYDIYIRSTTKATPAAPPPLSFPAPSTTEPHLVPLEVDSTAPRSLLASPAPDLSSFTPDDSELTHGILHLPTSESEQSYFWTSNPHEDSSSSDNDMDDDEDSNAEDYYGADYPEDEVDGDDEMGVGEWRFRRGSEGEDDYEDVGWAGRGGRFKIGRDGRLGQESADSSEEEEDEGRDGGLGNPWRR